jgi:glycosyl transferase, family 25
MISARRVARWIRSSPLIVHQTALSMFDAWPYARRIPQEWQQVPVYCVTIERAARRQKLISRQAERMGVRELEFVLAPDLSTTPRRELEAAGLYDDEQALRYHRSSLHPSQISCSLGHAAAYDRIVAAGHDLALIIEDDALFISRRFRLLKLDSIPAGFDIVLLNTFRSTDQPDDCIGHPLYGTESFTGSTGAYLVSRAGAAKLAGVARPVIHAADGLIGRCMEWNGPAPHAFKQRGGPTILHAYQTIPDFVMNGSDAYYYRTFLRIR